MPRRDTQLQLEGLKQGAGRTCLVTGGSGFVGMALLRALRAEGWKVIATSQRAQVPSKGVKWVIWRADDGGVPECDWNKIDCVIHAANPRVSSRGIDELQRQFEGGVMATRRLIEKAAKHRVKRFVFVSTGDVVSPPNEVALESDGDYAPQSFYGAAKACSELLVRSCESILSTAVVRLYHPYGPGGDDFLINRLLAAVQAGREITVERGGGILMNPVWIDDVARGLALAAASDATGILHLGGAEKLRLAEFVQLAGRMLGKPVSVSTKPASPPRNHAGDCRRARRCLGWRPQVSLKHGLRKMIQPLEQLSGGI